MTRTRGWGWAYGSVPRGPSGVSGIWCRGVCADPQCRRVAPVSVPCPPLPPPSSPLPDVSTSSLALGAHCSPCAQLHFTNWQRCQAPQTQPLVLLGKAVWCRIVSALPVWTPAWPLGLRVEVDHPVITKLKTNAKERV